MIEMNKHNKDLVVLSYEMTLACNNRCSYCYALDYLDNSKIINEEVFNDTIKSFSEYINSTQNTVKIDILGGEPLLVIDYVKEFIDKTNSKNSTYTIFTNLNFKTSTRIQKVHDLLNNNSNVLLNISWHKSSDQEKMKQNIIRLKDLNILIVFLVNDNNFEEVHSNMLWLKQNTNCNYTIEFLRDKNNESELTDFNNYYYKELLKYSQDRNYKNMLDDKEYSVSEILEMGFLDVAKKYTTVCQLTQLKVDYNGNLCIICANPYSFGNIKNGITIKEIFCNKYSCLCSTNNYKKLYGAR